MAQIDDILADYLEKRHSVENVNAHIRDLRKKAADDKQWIKDNENTVAQFIEKHKQVLVGNKLLTLTKNKQIRVEQVMVR